MNDPDQLMPNSDSQIDLQLTAYLDGELDDDAVLSVEQRLSSDANYLGRMQKLQKTWDLLDLLPRAQATASFTQSTLDLVVVEARQSERKRRSTWLNWWIRGTALFSLATMALVGSYWYTQYWQAQPVEQFVEDLPVIQNADVYRKAESIEFLTLLDQSGLFDSEREFVVDSNREGQ